MLDNTSHKGSNLNQSQKFLEYIEEKSEEVELEDDDFGRHRDSFPMPLPGNSLEMDNFDIINERAEERRIENNFDARMY